MSTSQNILVVGDFMTDVYWIGTASRVSPEAPCLIIDIEQTSKYAGGAGNVGFNLEALGAKVITVGQLGPIKNRLIVDWAQIVRWDENDRCEPIHRFADSKCSLSKIVVADYGKGTITPSLIDQIRSLNLPTFVDTKSDPTPYTGWATAVFPNAKEYKQYETQYNLFERCILKLGSDGIAELKFGKIKRSYPAFAERIVSVNGAGDTVLAAYTFKYPHGNPLHFANLAAAVAVEKPFTSIVTLKEINALNRRLSNNRRRDSRGSKKA